MLLAKSAVTPRSRWCSPPPKQSPPIVLAHLIPPGGMRPRHWSHSVLLLAPRVVTFPTNSTPNSWKWGNGCNRGLPRLNRRLPPVLPHPTGPWHPRRYDGATLFCRYSAPTTRLPMLLLVWPKEPGWQGWGLHDWRGPALPECGACHLAAPLRGACTGTERIKKKNEEQPLAKSRALTS